ncbi:unnamed protein product [Clonostachys chloroleuca]|uniref:PHD-type domain-containing protein n=1 Tax=Clonostachys chloroleuca TaxID=1926264 RepID=A0AA35M1R8_9HYPO|nr:unnamed protein product [Clonostachys chloroleuca]
MAAEPTADNAGDTLMADLSPRQQATHRFDDASPRQIRKTMATFEEHRSDPDAQTTVTDFLDFTEYLPSDIIRSLTLIEKHDHQYVDSSTRVYELTKTWGQLPTMQANERPSPVQLRADISEHLNQAVSSRIFAHAESLRMSENVNRHYNKAKLLLSKLQAMLDNYPTEKQQALSPVMSRSPQLSRAKLAGRSGEDGEPKVRQKRMPKIMVPGEVLAPYDIEYDTFTDGSDVSTDNDDDDVPATVRKNISATPRIKLVSSTPRPPKSSHRSTRPASHTTPASAEAVAAQAAALLNPPPENAPIGSSHAPWLQLTEYELAKLRKRMKKNATWTPSETMVARELRALGRGPEDFKEAKKKAENEGKTFEFSIPAALVDDGSGTQQLPAGAISVDSAAIDELPMSNRGMKLNEAKKLKREALAKQAAEEAEESARKMAEAAKLLLGSNGTPSGGPSESPKESGGKSVKTTRANSRSNAKRKRDAELLKVESETPEGSDSPSRPVLKRTKTETPVPPPIPATPRQASVNASEGPTSETQSHTQSQFRQPTPGVQGGIHVETPVPIPMPPQASSNSSTPAPTKPPSSPPAADGANQAESSSVSLKPPVVETSAPMTRSGRRKSNTPVPPPLRELPSREVSRRETRGGAAKRLQQQPQTPTEPPIPPHEIQLPTIEQRSRRSASRATTPGKGSEGNQGRRPVSRGKSVGQESLAADRPRRASTARNTPAPESRPPKRTKRPAPGVVSITRSGGNSAVGKRKAAPRKKPRTRREKDQDGEMEDVDDEGNPIDPNEPRYCNCNRVSFGTMIQCDNVDGCKGEWFHLECVGLEEIPARTTKWYCPDCRRVLNIGERGEVSARGVRK